MQEIVCAANPLATIPASFPDGHGAEKEQRKEGSRMSSHSMREAS
jgi:hypothetical protein